MEEGVDDEVMRVATRTKEQISREEDVVKIGKLGWKEETKPLSTKPGDGKGRNGWGRKEKYGYERFNKQKTGKVSLLFKTKLELGKI